MNSLLILRWWVKQNKKLQTLELFISDFGLQKAHFVCNPVQKVNPRLQTLPASWMKNSGAEQGVICPKTTSGSCRVTSPLPFGGLGKNSFYHIVSHCWQVLINLDLESDKSDKHSVTGSSISHSYFILWTGLVSEVSAASFTQKQRRYCPVLDTWGGSQTVCSHSCHDDSCGYGDIYWKLKAPGQSQISIFRLIQST